MSGKSLHQGFPDPENPPIALIEGLSKAEIKAMKRKIRMEAVSIFLVIVLPIFKNWYATNQQLFVYNFGLFFTVPR